MTNFEKLVNSLTPENITEMSVKLITVNNSQLFWVTSSGQLFPYEKRDSAVRYEYNWLITDDDVKDVDDSPVEPDINITPITTEDGEEPPLPGECASCDAGENCTECECELCPYK